MRGGIHVVQTCHPQAVLPDPIRRHSKNCDSQQKRMKNMEMSTSELEAPGAGLSVYRTPSHTCNCSLAPPRPV